MAKYLLALIGLLYLVLTIWCTTKQELTSGKVGLIRQPGQGESEYLTIYGGVQLALALLFFMPVVRPEMTLSMLLTCTVVHGCLVLFRTIAFVQYSDFPRMTYQLAAGEWIILIVSAALLLMETRR